MQEKTFPNGKNMQQKSRLLFGGGKVTIAVGKIESSYRFGKGRFGVKYLIGDVARTMGLTPAALHFYEREGVIDTVKGSGTRRSYGPVEILRLISYKKYRSMEMPLKEIAQQFSENGDTFEEIGDKLARQQQALHALCDKYRRLAEDVDWFSQAIRRSEGAIGRVDVASLPACYVLCLGEDGFITRDRAQQAQIAAWLEYLPATRISTICETDGRARFGYTVDLARGEALGLDQTPGITRLDSRAAMHAFVSLERTYYDHPEMAFDLLRDFLQGHGFKQAGRALAVNLCVSHFGQKRDTLCEVWVPFE